MAQTNPQSGFVQRAIAAIRAWLRASIPGFAKMRLADSEIIENYLIPARQFVLEGRRNDVAADLAVAFARNFSDRIDVDGVMRPATDSEGQRIHATDEGIRNFWRWFDGKKGVAGKTGQGANAGRVFGTVRPDTGSNWSRDQNGRPRLLYHGTKDDISAFDLDHPNRKDKGWLGRGVYLTSSIHQAELYANQKRGSGGPTVMPLYAAVRNPYIATLAQKRNFSRASAADIARATEKLKQAGYDGVALDNGDGSFELVVFDPAAVKSAIGNQGTYSPDNPDIRFSRSATTAPQAAPAAGPQANKSPLRDRMARIVDTLIYNFQDRFKPLKDIQKQAGDVPENMDASLAEERYSGKVRARVDDFEAELREPLIKAIHESGVSYDDVQKFLHARHAPSRNKAMREINPTEAELKARTEALERKRDGLAKDVDMAKYVKLRHSQ